MKIGILKEARAHELRCAATPETVKKYAALGAEILIEAGAGSGASISDAAFAAAGAAIVASAAEAGAADIVLKVQRPMTQAEGADEFSAIRKGAVLIAILDPHGARDSVQLYAQRGIDAMAMELVPRITRAQAMDVLSSQSNLAGYRAVIDAAGEFGRAFPMMMTAAGTIAPARVLVMGAGVAGLQAPSSAPPTCARRPRNRCKVSAPLSLPSRTRNSSRRKPPAAMPRK
jgi:H+-translocating NAD(P) transhydrogenase subunit alpha